MATYIESALGDFIKSILTRGIRTLKSPRFFPYSVFLLLIVVITSVTAFLDQITGEVTNSLKDNLLYLELAAAISFVWVGLFLGRLNIKLQISILLMSIIALIFVFKSELIEDSDKLTINIAAIFYILWIGIVAFSTFSVMRDLFANDTFGTILFLGKPEDDGNVMFSSFAWILVFVNLGLGYFVIQNTGGSDSIYLSGIIIIILSLIAVLPLFGIQRHNDAFWTILTTFYMFTTIKIVLFTFQVVSGGEESTSIWDLLFSLFIALYTIQNAAARGITLGQKLDDDDDNKSQDLEEKLMREERGGFTAQIARLLSDRGIVLVILGIVLGYHTMQIQTILGRENYFQEISFFEDADIVILGHEINLMISLFIYVISLVLFLILPSFRKYANPEIHRITWLPPYEDLKEVVINIKSGEVDWKMDVTKMIIGMGKDKLASKFGRNKKPKSAEDRFTNTFKKLRGKKD